MRKYNDKPLKQFLSSYDREVILLIVTAAQLNLAEFCLSFKEKLKFAIPCKREDFKKIQCTAGFNRHTLQKEVLRRLAVQNFILCVLL